MAGAEKIIFISYAHADFAAVKNLADLLNNALNNLDFKTWFDNDLQPNSIWKDELSRMIAGCDRFLHVTSPDSVTSEWCQWELVQAAKLDKPILLVLLRAIDSDHPLHKIHHINFQEHTTGALASLIGEIFQPRTLSPDALPSAPENPRGLPSRSWDRAILSPPLIAIPAGPFVMGSDPARDPALYESERPQHTVDLPAFSIGKYPLRVREFRAFVDSGGYRDSHYWTAAGWEQRERRNWTNPYHWDEPQCTGDDDLPVVGVSWFEAHAYTRWLSEVSGRQYRLPTESEWEKAARGTDGRIHPWDNEWRDDVCNTLETGLGYTTHVERFSPHGDSPYDVADMIGNVREWCASKWRDHYADGAEDNDPDGFGLRVVRGVAFNDPAYWARCAYRAWFDPDKRFDYFGFRVACDDAPGSA